MTGWRNENCDNWSRKLGIRITEALLDGDYDVTVVDNNEKKIRYTSPAV